MGNSKPVSRDRDRGKELNTQEQLKRGDVGGLHQQEGYGGRRGNQKGVGVKSSVSYGPQG